MKKIIFSCLFFLSTFFVFGQSQDQNYVKSTTYRKASTTVLPASPNIEDGIVNISYFDGLGRPIQQIAHKQSATGKDIVTHIEYDSFGRQAKDYLPYPSTQSSMAYIDGISAVSDITSYYSGVYNDFYPFAEKKLEQSPLNRVLKQGAPGEDWQIATSGNDHSIKFDYQTNQESEVKLFKANTGSISSNGVYDVTLIQNHYYDHQQLYKTIVTDENGSKTMEYKDKEGRVVLKRSINGKDFYDTYYVYDSYGNLSYVIPPKAADLGTIDTIALNNLCYQYLYDSRNRLIEKKIPGKTWEYIVYDKLDRVVAIGPALSPFNDSSATGWLVTKYDAFGRVIYTGWSTINNATTSTNRNTLQLFMNTTSEINESKQTANNNLNGVILNYTNVVYPSLTPHILTVNYYDDYNYPNPPALIPTVIEGEAVTSNLKGLPTGSWVRVLTTTSETLHEMTHTFYDKKGRPIHTHQKNHLGGYTQTDVKLDFIGTTLYTVTKHKRTNTDTEITLREDFDYTPEGRLLEHTHKINNLTTETLSHNEYDELGQLIIKKVGKTPNDTPLQIVDYKYNIRGWLTDINNVETLGDDLFAFKLSYNDVKNSVWGLIDPLYNGNISETFWKTSTDNQIRKYGYIYDDLNRLDNSIYQKTPTVNAQNSAITSYDSYNEGNVIYDKNGNIIQIRRNGDLDSEEFNIQIDWLFYTYDSGNKLLKVSDGSNHPEGFKDGTNSGDDYAYDTFGNMTQDLNKGIPANGISYNHLNLPKEISFSGSPTRKINYLYNALGQKVEKIVTNGTAIITTNYLNGFHYENNDLKFFATAEGYVNVTIMSLGTQTFTNFNYVYNYTDHLGNIRLSYTNNSVNGITILEENHYYPFGLKHKKYGATEKRFVKSNGGYFVGIETLPPGIRKTYQYKVQNKEWQDELGLNLYDFHARNYMPDIGRTTTLDPMAEMFYSISPYSFLNNSPLYFVDPTGMSSEEWLKVGNIYKWDDRVTDQATAIQYHGENAKHIGVNKTVSTVRNGKTIDSVTLNDNGTVTKDGTTLQVNDKRSFTNKNGSTFKARQTSGDYAQISASFAFLGGFGVSAGVVTDAVGDSKFFVTFDANLGFGLGTGIDAGKATPTGNNQFLANDFAGNSGSYNVGITAPVVPVDANWHRGGSIENNWHATDKMNYNKFGEMDRGYKTTQGGFGVGGGARAGGMWSYGTTKVF